MKQILAIAAFLAVLATSTTAATFNFTADVTSIGNDLGFIGTTGVTTSSTITGQFSFDFDEQIDRIDAPSWSSVTTTLYIAPVGNLSATIGTVTASGDPNLMIVRDSPLDADTEGFLFHASDSSGGMGTGLAYDNVLSSIQFATRDNSVFAQGVLPQSFDLDDFYAATFTFNGFIRNNDDQDFLSATITDVTLVPTVPLPAGLPLLLTGFAGFAALRRRG